VAASRITVQNRILAALPKKEYERLFPQLEPVKLPHGEILYEPDDSVSHIYFVNEGMASLVSVTEEGQNIEVGVIGKEGMIGFRVVLGVDTTQNQVIVQMPGSAFKMKTKEFKAELNRLGVLQNLLLRYTQAMLTLVTQAVVCNRFHQVEQRLARWLLISHDRAESDELLLTQEFLAIMLGVHRPGVNVAAGMLEKAGLIRHSRGKVTVMNRQGLEAASCECYGIVKKGFDWFLSI
jgi:CRP-like cAMP-binding protein